MYPKAFISKPIEVTKQLYLPYSGVNVRLLPIHVIREWPLNDPTVQQVDVVISHERGALFNLLLNTISTVGHEPIDVQQIKDMPVADFDFLCNWLYQYLVAEKVIHSPKKQ